MPRTNSRKRNNHRNDNSFRVPVASSLSPNAQEFIPTTNNEATAIQRDDTIPLNLIVCNESSSAPNSSGNVSNSSNSESTNTHSSIADSLSQKGQRDLLINLLNCSKVDCVICYERAKNVEPVWNCRNCYQIMHLKCIMVWYIKSHRNATWRCPACQNECYGKPTYVCFCGALPNPFSNNVDTPHSCGQVCGLIKKNVNSEYNDCHHKCTLLCHPGPCPQCVVQVLRKCGCEKTKIYVHCGQSTPVVCENICYKELNCKNHICDKPCHPNKCEPCKENCPQNDDEAMQCNDELTLSIISANNALLQSQRQPFPRTALVTEEELQMLGLDAELLSNRNDDDESVVFYEDTSDSENDSELNMFADIANADDDSEDDDSDVNVLNDYVDNNIFNDDDDDESIDTLERFYGWSGNSMRLPTEFLAANLFNDTMSEVSSSSSSNSTSRSISSNDADDHDHDEDDNNDNESDNYNNESDNYDNENSDNDDGMTDSNAHDESDNSSFITDESDDNMDVGSPMDESDSTDHSHSSNNSDFIFGDNVLNVHVSSSSSQSFSEDSSSSSVVSSYDSNSYSSSSGSSSSS